MGDRRSESPLVRQAQRHGHEHGHGLRASSTSRIIDSATAHYHNHHHVSPEESAHAPFVMDPPRSKTTTDVTTTLVPSRQSQHHHHHRQHHRHRSKQHSHSPNAVHRPQPPQSRPRSQQHHRHSYSENQTHGRQQQPHTNMLSYEAKLAAKTHEGAADSQAHLNPQKGHARTHRRNKSSDFSLLVASQKAKEEAATGDAWDPLKLRPTGSLRDLSALNPNPSILTPRLSRRSSQQDGMSLAALTKSSDNLTKSIHDLSPSITLKRRRSSLKPLDDCTLFVDTGLEGAHLAEKSPLPEPRSQRTSRRASEVPVKMDIDSKLVLGDVGTADHHAPEWVEEDRFFFGDANFDHYSGSNRHSTGSSSSGHSSRRRSSAMDAGRGSRTRSKSEATKQTSSYQGQFMPQRASDETERSADSEHLRMLDASPVAMGEAILVRRGSDPCMPTSKDSSVTSTPRQSLVQEANTTRARSSSLNMGENSSDNMHVVEDITDPRLFGRRSLRQHQRGSTSSVSSQLAKGSQSSIDEAVDADDLAGSRRIPVLSDLVKTKSGVSITIDGDENPHRGFTPSSDDVEEGAGHLDNGSMQDRVASSASVEDGLLQRQQREDHWSAHVEPTTTPSSVASSFFCEVEDIHDSPQSPLSSTQGSYDGAVVSPKAKVNGGPRPTARSEHSSGNLSICDGDRDRDGDGHGHGDGHGDAFFYASPKSPLSPQQLTSLTDEEMLDTVHSLLTGKSLSRDTSPPSARQNSPAIESQDQDGQLQSRPLKSRVLDGPSSTSSSTGSRPAKARASRPSKNTNELTIHVPVPPPRSDKHVMSPQARRRSQHLLQLQDADAPAADNHG